MPRLFKSAVAILLSLPLLAFSQPLVDRVPADSLVYIGWQGVELDAASLRAVAHESDAG